MILTGGTPHEPPHVLPPPGNAGPRGPPPALCQTFKRHAPPPTRGPPPPITTTSRPLKKNPSQVAHALTPRPLRRSSFGSPRYLAFAPVAMITERPSCIPSEVQTLSGRFEKSTFDTLSSTNSALNRCACWRQSSISSGPWTPFGKPG